MLSIYVDPDTDDAEIQVDYSLDGGISWSTIGRRIGDQDRNFKWLIPDVEAEDCLIRIRDLGNPGSEVTSPVFSIGPVLVGEIQITGPGPGEVVMAGSMYWLQYQPFHLSVGIREVDSDLLLEYSLDGGETWTIGYEYGLGWASRVFFPWWVPDVETDECYIKLSSTRYPGMVGSVGPVSIRRVCPCGSGFASMYFANREGENLADYLRQTPLIRLVLGNEADVRISPFRSTGPLVGGTFRSRLAAGEYILDPIEMFGIAIGYAAGRIGVNMEATCMEGSPSCRMRVADPAPGSRLAWQSPRSAYEGWMWAAVHSSACASGEAVLSPNIDVMLMPIKGPDIWGVDSLHYYWGESTDDFDVMSTNAVEVPLSWREGVFTATDFGEWLFAVWGEADGERSTEVIRFEASYVADLCDTFDVGLALERKDLGQLFDPISEAPLLLVELTRSANVTITATLEGGCTLDVYSGGLSEGRNPISLEAGFGEFLPEPAGEVTFAIEAVSVDGCVVNSTASGLMSEMDAARQSDVGRVISDAIPDTDGQQIRVGSGSLVIDGSLPSYVRHGGWRTEEACHDVTFGSCSDSSFALYVDGERMPSTAEALASEPLGAAPAWGCMWLTTFPANHFAPGEYEFRGEWRAPGFSRSSQVTVTVEYPNELTITCPPEAIVCGGGTSIHPDRTGYATSSGGFGEVTIQYEDESIPGSPGAHYRTWEAIDSQDNSRTCVQVLETDLIRLVCPDDTLFEAGGSRSPEVTGYATAPESVCSSTVIEYEDQPVEDSPGAYWRIWSATDAFGNYYSDSMCQQLLEPD